MTSRGPHTHLTRQMRLVTHPAHARIEETPFVEALIARTLTTARYVDQLRALAIVFTSLERILLECGDEAVLTAWDAAYPQAELLLDDLAAYDREGHRPDDPAPTRVALECVGHLTTVAQEHPRRLLGALYVTQGMTLGNQRHIADARAAAGPVGAVSWYTGPGAQATLVFRDFCNVLNDLGLDAATQHAVAGVAGETIERLHDLHVALHPGQCPKRRLLATTFNPEAGAHPVVADPVLAAAAVRAGRRCLERHPYFAARYGDRGARFAHSDVAWLAGLIDAGEEVAVREVTWLADVLARRGMPSLLLEDQLRLLEAELTEAGAGPGADTLGAAARRLHDRRTAMVGVDAGAQLTEAFVDGSDEPPEEERREAAALLLSAVADEANGTPGVVTSVTRWLRSRSAADEWNESISRLLLDAFAIVAR